MKKMGTKKIEIKLSLIVIPIIVLFLFLFTTWTRLGTMKDETVLDYDPWWQYRYAKMILENGMKIPKWDLLSFFPPGRPTNPALGWEYTMIFFYKVLSPFIRDFTFMEAAKLSPALMVGFASVAAFFLGKTLTNNWGGIATGIFAALTPTFIGVSMAGYCDTDVVVVFYSFISILSIIVALKKSKIYYYVIALAVNLLFIYNWFFGWYVTVFFFLFIPILIGYRIFEGLIQNRKLDQKTLVALLSPPVIIIYKIFEKTGLYVNKNLGELLKDNDLVKKTVEIFVFVLLMGLLSFLIGFGSIIDFVQIGLGFAGGSEGGIVNVSVAELQPISILTKSGFMSVVQRIGLGPMLLFIIGLPVLVFYKIYKKERASFVEIFLFMWSVITFYLILHGVRFSLLFSAASTTAAGYVVGNLIKKINLGFLIFSGSFLIYSFMIFNPSAILTLFFVFGSIALVLASLFVFFRLERNDEKENDLIKATFLGVTALLVLIFISDAMIFANQAGGMEVSHNWIEMLEWMKKNADPKAEVATWWDPGHIIAGYTGLRVHADGAHCGTEECIPYPHNTRIQDMGRMMTTSNETETVELLKKYMVLTPEQCNEVKEKYGDIVPKEACESATEMYFIASSDLIGKYTWMDYFGGYRAPIASPQNFEKNPGVCCPSTPDAEPGQMSCGEFAGQGKGVWVWCPWIFNFEGQQQDQQGNPVFVYAYSGLKIAIIQKGNELIPVYSNKYAINNMIFYNQGKEQRLNLSNSTLNLEKIDGMIWVDPSFQNLIYFSPSVKSSIFTRLFFFNGEGLDHFELVFSNSEVKLFKVKF